MTPGGDGYLHPGSTQPPARAAGRPDTLKVVFRSLTARWDPRSATSTANVTPMLLAFRILILVTVAVTVLLFAQPPPGDGARRTAVLVALGVAAAGWAAWLLARNRRTQVWLRIPA